MGAMISDFMFSTYKLWTPKKWSAVTCITLRVLWVTALKKSLKVLVSNFKCQPLGIICAVWKTFRGFLENLYPKSEEQYRMQSFTDHGLSTSDHELGLTVSIAIFW
jgi:hypothetical protein